MSSQAEYRKRYPNPYENHAPKSGILRKLWILHTRFEATFALNIIEPWERVLVYTVVLSLSLIFWFSVLTYYPPHLSYLRRRFSYYVFEDESVDVWSVGRAWIWEHMNRLRLGGGTAGAVGDAMKRKGAEL